MANTFQGAGYLGTDYVGTNYVGVSNLVQLPVPNRPYKITTSKSQSSARTLGGAFYVYDRSLITRSYNLTFPKVTAAVLAQILAFFDNDTTGNQVPFTWTDHQGTVRTVKLQGSINVAQYNPIYYQVSLTLFEQFTDESVFRDWPYMGTDYVGTGYVAT